MRRNTPGSIGKFLLVVIGLGMYIFVWAMLLLIVFLIIQTVFS
jgi:hypothetical protein